MKRGAEHCNLKVSYSFLVYPAGDEESFQIVSKNLGSPASTNIDYPRLSLMIIDNDLLDCRLLNGVIIQLTRRNRLRTLT